MTRVPRDSTLLRTLAVGRAVACLSVAVALPGCEPRDIELAPELIPDAGSAGAIRELQGLRITPSSHEATFDGSKLDRSVVFRAYGKFPSGERDVTNDIEWSLTRATLGTIARGRFQPAAVGGRTEVVARSGEFSATAQLRVRLDIVVKREVDDSTVTAFSVAETGDRTGSLSAPSLSYPITDTIIPSNLTHMRYQWRAPAELNRFELLIDSANARLRYYTTQRAWLDDLDSSKFLAPSHPGESVRIRVRALASTAPGTVYRSDEVTLRVADLSLSGESWYWSSTARGIKRGDLSSDHAARVVTDPAGTTATTCTGCHAISRDGKRLAVADGTDRLALFALPEGAPQAFSEPVPPMPAMPTKGPKPMMMPAAGAPAMDPGPAIPMPTIPPMAADMPPPAAMPPPPGMPPRGPADYGWGSFNPDGSQLAYASKGKLHIIDASTGQELPKVHLPPETSVTQPDWSPDGTSIAVAVTLGKAPKSNKLVRASGIARLVVQADGMLGDAEPVVASTGPDDTLSAPAYSPDGRWIAFARSSGSSKDNPSSQLWIVAADGSSEPVLLERANRPLGADLMTPPAAANAMPTWALASGGDLTFLTFSTTRDYGDVIVDVQRDQLWASALDLELLAAGKDPSAPAFWLPFQDPSESNHRALWTPASANCVPSAEVCDGRDDDCDGTVDESCCAASAEDCSDDVDNDCDGVANEGCGCFSIDVCDNGLDEDCDQHVDEDCKE